jgi:hypothetical protein
MSQNDLFFDDENFPENLHPQDSNDEDNDLLNLFDGLSSEPDDEQDEQDEQDGLDFDDGLPAEDYDQA